MYAESRCHFLFPLVLLALAALNLFGAIAVKGESDPLTDFTIARAGQSVVLSWFAESEVVYQLEASTDLVDWSEIGSLVVGDGNTMMFQFPTFGQDRFFFRLKLPGVRSANFDPITGVLTIMGDPSDGIIVLSRDAAGNLLINGGDYPISGGTATATNTTVIRIFGGEGADQIALDESNGPLPRAELSGEGGNDTLIGGSAGDFLNGGAGDDFLFGMAGADQLFGGDNNDTLAGGDGDDQIFGENDIDHLVWNPGDDTDLNEGGPGGDIVQVNGDAVAEVFTTTANGPRVRFDELGPTPSFLDIGTCEFLVVNTNGGNDQFSCVGNLAPLIAIMVDGGAGDDILLGSNGADVFLGGDDNDFIDGQQGSDTAYLGNGNDTFQWDPGDGSDVIEGQNGIDRLLFNGSNGNENLAVSANGARTRFTRDLGVIVMDLDDVETIEANLFGGTDNLTVNDLAGTDVSGVVAHLPGFNGLGDGAVDSVFVNGTSSADSIFVTAPNGLPTVNGVAAIVSVEGFEPGTDSLRIQGLGGDDIFDVATVGASAPAIVFEGGEGSDTVRVNGADDSEGFTTTANGTRVRFDRSSPAPFFLDIGTCELLALNMNGGNDQFAAIGSLAVLISIRVDGGAGDDQLLGSNGDDTLIGGDNNDFVDGQQGSDTVFLGGGDDTFQWDPGDGSDTVEGQAGHDTIVFHGSATGEVFTFAANGARLHFTRNIAAIALDADDIEQFNLRALGNTDTITVNDLSGTDVTQVNLDLAGVVGGTTGDAQSDAITINGTAAPDAFVLTANSGAVEISGHVPHVRITHADAASDSLTVNGLGDTDTFTVDGGVASLIQLTTNQ